MKYKYDKKELKKLFEEIKKCNACQKIKGYLGGPIPAVVGNDYRGIVLLMQNPGAGGYNYIKCKYYHLERDRFKDYNNCEYNDIQERLMDRISTLEMYKWIHLLDIMYNQCAFVESYKCTSGKIGDSGWFINEGHSREMLNNCNKKQFTLKEINALNPKIIISIGGIARKFLEKNKEKFNNKKLKNEKFRPHLKHTSRFLPTKKDIENLKKIISEIITN